MSEKALLPKHKQEHVEEGEGNWLVSYADMMTLLVGFFVILLSFSTVDQEKLEKVKQAAAKEFGGSYQVPYGDMADRLKAALQKLGMGEQFSIKESDIGVEISFLGAVFFNIGSADVKPEAGALLNQLIPIVQSESKDFHVIIEGHTDDVPIRATATSEFRSNWELSSVRACRVLDVFVNNGFTKEHLTAVGYADARPVVPNSDAAGNPIPANQSQNRRVVIKLLKGSGTPLQPEAPHTVSAPEQPASQLLQGSSPPRQPPAASH